MKRQKSVKISKIPQYINKNKNTDNADKYDEHRLNNLFLHLKINKDKNHI